MYSVGEFKDELKHHSVHVSHGQHAQHLVARLYLLAHHLYCEVAVAPQRAVGNHHALGVAGRSAGVVNECQVVGLILVVADVLGSEVERILLSEEPVEVLACILEAVVGACKQAEVCQRDDAFECGHGCCIEFGPHLVAHKEQACTAVVHDVVYLRGVELMQDGYCHCAVGEYAEERSSPAAQVSSAESDAVALLDACMFEQDVHLLDDASYIFILKGAHSIV